ncbi:MAG TPA: NifU family protein [Ilumatobacteraceae bacterium]|nr:NifU family protein [Ilumatobacteraceae bacterium]
MSSSAPPTHAPIITVTPAALTELVTLRADEPDSDDLALRLGILSGPGEDFRYDLGFESLDTVTFADQVRTHEHEGLLLKVIVARADIESLQDATLDFSESQGLVIRNPNRPKAPKVEGLVSDDEMSDLIRAELSGEVNPALAAHGGFVTYVGHDGQGTAYLTMGGGCHGCSMSMVTMLEGVQTMLTEAIPGVERVRDLTDHATGQNPFYR